MEILLKKKTASVKEIFDEKGNQTMIPILSIYFDVITDYKAYVDNDDIGYFPIEITGDINTSNDDITKACDKWLTDNNVLDVYAGIDIDEYMITKKTKEMARNKAVTELETEGYIFKVN